MAQRGLEALGYPVLWEGEHTLRRSGARAYADRLRSDGVDNALLATAAMLGHKDTKVTMVYIGWELEKDARNKSIAGQPLFPGIQQETGLRVVREADHG